MAYGISDPDAIDKAGDFKLDKVIIHSTNGARIDIRLTVLELSIYESIYNPFVTGTITVSDASDMMNTIPILGQEELEFELKTPGTEYPFTHDFTRHLARIFKITDKVQTTDRSCVYTLHFISREGIRNLRTRISRRYHKMGQDIIESILRTDLESVKNMNLQEDKRLQTYLAPNVRPMTAIQTVANRMKATISGYDEKGFLFYETSKGFNCRSYSSLFVDGGGDPLVPVMVYTTQPQVLGDGVTKVDADYSNIPSFDLTETNDIIKSSLEGAFASKKITHDIVTKEIKTTNYNFFDDFDKTKHVDDTGDGQFGPIVSRTWENAKEETLGDFKDNRIFVTPKASYLYTKSDSDTNIYSSFEEDLQTRTSRQSTMKSNRLTLTVAGLSSIEAGSIIQVYIPRNAKLTGEDKMDTDIFDPRLSGRYLVVNAHHKTSIDRYDMVLDCVKDTVFTAYEDFDFSHDDVRIEEKGETLLV